MHGQSNASEGVLFLSPEAVSPAVGGGALRSASILEYLVERCRVDVIGFRENGRTPRFPGARETLILDLPPHSRTFAARARRNVRRALAGSPPLTDRYSGFAPVIAAWLQGRHYETAMVEHFWCAPYASVLRPHASRLVLDMHNIESRLQETSAASAPWPQSWLYRRFAAAYRSLEAQWCGRYDLLLATSGADASRIDVDRVAVYPNTIPYREMPRAAREHAIVFSGNLDYEPNVLAVKWFANAIWPLVCRADPHLEWRLIGMNPAGVAEVVRGLARVKLVGPVEDAVYEIARSKAAVVPLTAGSGTRFKILEAWAAATPVVSTTLGAEGLGGIAGKHLLIADTVPAFAQAVLQAVRDPGPIGLEGRNWYIERYTTESGWRMLDALGLAGVIR